MKTKGVIIEDASVLIPNKDHKNFTESSDKITKGNEVEGQIKYISGLRRGKPFTYRLFLTDKNQFIYLKNINPMKATEVTLGTDAQVSATKVNLTPADGWDNSKFIAVILGGVAGFAWAKYKKHDMKKMAMYIGVGALAGYGVAYLMNKNKKVVITPSK